MPRTILANFILHNPAPRARIDDTVVSGVPLAPGVAPDTAALTVCDAAGVPLACQCDAAARWADGSVKWLLVTLPGMALAAGARARLTLRRGVPPVPAGAVTLRRTAGGLRLTAGDLRVTLVAKGALISEIARRVNRRWVPRVHGLDLVVAVERDGVVTTYRAGDAPRTLTVETCGPCRAVVCVRGVHQTATSACGPYTLRVEVRAGETGVRLTHSLVFDLDPARDFLRACEVTATAAVGGAVEMAFGGDDGHEVRCQRQYTPWHADYRYAELYQDSVSHWRVRRWVDRDRREVFCEDGLQSDGWAELRGPVGRVAIAVRDLWQQHPKTLAVDAETGDMRAGLYPPRADRLDLRRYSDHIYPMAYEAPCTWRNETLPVNPADGAQGIRKTHDLLLLCDTANPSVAVAQYAHPLRLAWTPAYLARTGVVEPAASRRDRAWLARVDAWLDLLGLAMVRDGGTGYLDYFDLPMGFNPVEGRWSHDYGGRGYINDEAMPVLGLWYTALYTGRPDAFALARAMARHTADIDSYHIGPWAGYGSRHNVNHWGDACKEPRISQPLGKRYLYYLEGDHSPLDLVEVMLAMWRALPAGTTLPISAHVPALVSTLLTATETGLACEDAWLWALADALAASVDSDGRMSALLAVDPAARAATPCPASRALSLMMFSCFGGLQSFAELAARYNHAPLRAALVRMARAALCPPADAPDAMGDSLRTFRLLDLFAYAYLHTGDPVFPAHVRAHARTVHVAVVDLPVTRYGQSGAGRRSAPAVIPWPDETEADRAAIRRYYPIPGTADSQFFEIAVYLHKLPGLLLLMGAE